MKLTTRQLDALASEIRTQLLAKKSDEKGKEKYVAHYLEIMKTTGLMDQITNAFNSQIIRDMYLDLPKFFEILGIKEPDWYVYNCIKSHCIEECIMRTILETYDDHVPSFDTIKHRLILESIALGQEETIDDFISRMVEKFE